MHMILKYTGMEVHPEDANDLKRRIEDGDEMQVPGIPGQPKSFRDEFADY